MPEKKPHSAALFKAQTLKQLHDPKYEADILAATETGRQAGYRQARIDLLTWLEDKYIKSKIDRRSPEAKVMLKLVREIQLEFFGKENGVAKQG